KMLRRDLGVRMSYSFGSFELDTAARELRNGTLTVAVEPKVFDVLCVLIENRDRVVSKDELIELVWNGRFISDSAVSTAIKAVRQAVGDDGRAQSIVRTIHGHGFRFVADLAEAERADAPESLPAPAIRTNLRRRRRTLIGRDAESAEILKHLAPGRIVSIVGPGGAGKSALALDAASKLRDQFTGGVWFCELAPAREGQVESVVLGAIDSSAGAGPVNAATIAERFGETATLLVLDNCEHVIEAAARLAEDLIDTAPNLALLTTSREALEVAEEKLINLGGLSYTHPDSMAVEMFRHCAQHVTDLSQSTEETETIRQITARLEGLPLAIELAAPRLSSSTVGELLGALDDQLSVLATRRRRGEARHSAMDDAIAWSYNLLDGQEQAALTSLSVFSGAFTAQAAEAICDSADARSVLHNLVGQSMVAFLPGEPTSRFRLLEPIRQFAQRQLDDARRVALLERHANWFAARVTELAAQMRGAEEIAACEALTAEWSDFGRALAWGRDRRRADIAVAPLVALHIHLLWQLRIEGFGWLEAGVAACDVQQEDKARTDLVRSIGAWSMGDLDRSEALMEASVAAGGETIETAYFQFYQGFAREDFDKVYRCGLAAWQRAKASDDLAWQIASTAFHICGCAMHKGDAPEIPGLFEDVEALLARYPWPSGRCCALIGRTVAAFGRGAPGDVESYRIDLEKAADRCHAPWFKVTAAGIEASRTRNEHDAMAQLVMYTHNLKSAINSGDVIQLPTILRAIAICLVDVKAFETTAMLSGVIPGIRGLGEKGSLAPGYEDAVERAKAHLPTEVFERCAAIGRDWQLHDVVDALETVID
ncbi:MAG: winged helix-turn-helix domain-containing protein, partial [Pseudomonadota bacterium]